MSDTVVVTGNGITGMEAIASRSAGTPARSKAPKSMPAIGHLRKGGGHLGVQVRSSVHHVRPFLRWS